MSVWTPELIVDWMNAMPLIRWDRLNRWQDGGMGVTTSSAEWSEHISRMLHGGDPSATHVPCERVADVFPTVSWTTSG